MTVADFILIKLVDEGVSKYQNGYFQLFNNFICALSVFLQVLEVANPLTN